MPELELPGAALFGWSRSRFFGPAPPPSPILTHRTANILFLRDTKYDYDYDDDDYDDDDYEYDYDYDCDYDCDYGYWVGVGVGAPTNLGPVGSSSATLVFSVYL